MLRYSEPVHITESEADDGPFCAICRYGNTELSVYRGEWWCEECVLAEEEYEHGESLC